MSSPSYLPRMRLLMKHFIACQTSPVFSAFQSASRRVATSADSLRSSYRIAFGQTYSAEISQGGASSTRRIRLRRLCCGARQASRTCGTHIFAERLRRLQAARRSPHPAGRRGSRQRPRMRPGLHPRQWTTAVATALCCCAVQRVEASKNGLLPVSGQSGLHSTPDSCGRQPARR